MEQIMEGIKFFLFYGMQALALGLVVGIGVVAGLYELVRKRLPSGRAQNRQASPEPVQPAWTGSPEGPNA